MTTNLAPGALVGAYRLVRQLGAGGMGEVWLAEHTMLGRRAAIKVLHESVSRRPDIVARFFNEARAATAISDPGIVQIFDFGHLASGDAFIVMEMLEGESLEQRLRRSGPLRFHDGLRLVRKIAASLGAAHARGIVHRDLKPDNIFIVADPEVAGGERTKILDFGIAKLAGPGVGVKTQTSAVMGTPLYMSPEQCRGAGEVDQRSDVYALGCILFVVLTGRPPFDAEGPGDVLAMHLREPPPLLSTILGGTVGEVDDIVARCLAKSPAERFASGTALAAALAAALERGGQAITYPGAPAGAPPSSPTTLSSASSQLAPRGPVSRSSLLYGAFAIALVGIIGAIVMARRNGDPASDPDATSAAVSPAGSDAAGPRPPPPSSPAPPDTAPGDPAAPPEEAAQAKASPAPPPSEPPARPAAPVPSEPPARPARLAAPAPSRVSSPRTPKQQQPGAGCTAAAFLAVATASAPPESVVQDALAKLRKCKSVLSDSVFADLQQRLVSRL